MINYRRTGKPNRIAMVSSPGRDTKVVEFIRRGRCAKGRVGEHAATGTSISIRLLYYRIVNKGVVLYVIVDS